ncbi:amino acid permease, partial [Candidatus Neomarinimicrobiota bacterium]
MKRTLTLLDSTMINVGTIIGSGIFLVPTTIALYLHSSSLVVLVWLVAGILTLFGALSVAELGAAMPRAGGQFVYLKEAYSPVWGFLYGWSSFWVINSASIAALAVAFATYLGYFQSLTPLQIKLIAIAAIAAFTLLNIYGLRSGIWAQNVITFLKIGALLAIICLGLFLSGGETA